MTETSLLSAGSALNNKQLVQNSKSQISVQSSVVWCFKWIILSTTVLSGYLRDVDKKGSIFRISKVFKIKSKDVQGYKKGKKEATFYTTCSCSIKTASQRQRAGLQTSSHWTISSRSRLSF